MNKTSNRYWHIIEHVEPAPIPSRMKIKMPVNKTKYKGRGRPPANDYYKGFVKSTGE